MATHICILLCDDEQAVLRLLHMVCSRIVPNNLTHRPESPGQAELAAQQAAANPTLPLVTLSDHPLLIIETARLMATLSPATCFGLITDGNLLPEGNIRTGHDLIMELRAILKERLRMEVLFTGNPHEFEKLAREHGYALLEKPAPFTTLKALIQEFIESPD